MSERHRALKDGTFNNSLPQAPMLFGEYNGTLLFRLGKEKELPDKLTGRSPHRFRLRPFLAQWTYSNQQVAFTVIKSSVYSPFNKKLHHIRHFFGKKKKKGKKIASMPWCLPSQTGKRRTKLCLIFHTQKPIIILKEKEWDPKKVRSRKIILWCTAIIN